MSITTQIRYKGVEQVLVRIIVRHVMESKADMIHKLGIALKEANETKYWIEVIYRSELMSKDKYSELTNDVGELYKILAASIRTAKGNMG